MLQGVSILLVLGHARRARSRPPTADRACPIPPGQLRTRDDPDTARTPPSPQPHALVALWWRGGLHRVGPGARRHPASVVAPHRGGAVFCRRGAQLLVWGLRTWACQHWALGSGH